MVFDQECPQGAVESLLQEEEQRAVKDFPLKNS